MKGFFDRYDWRMKNRILWAGALVFLVACYQLAIKPMLRLHGEYQKLTEDENVRQANVQRLSELRNKTQHTGAVLAMRTDTAPDNRPEPERIAMMAQQQGVTVRSLPAPERLETGTWHVNYSAYRLEGGFIELLNVLHEVEQQADISLLSSSFVKQANPATREPELILLLRTVRLATDGKKDGI